MRVFILLTATATAMALLTAGCGDKGANPGGNNTGGGGGGGTNTGVVGGDTSEFIVVDGIKWMKKNLNIETADSSWCYGNNADNCGKYGRLYSFDAAKRACQSVGWRLPDTSDWNRLVGAAGGYSEAGKRLKSSDGWLKYSGYTNTDDLGFSALPGGFSTTDGRTRSFVFGDYQGWWWTATAAGNSGDSAYVRGMFYYNGVDVSRVQIGRRYCVDAECLITRYGSIYGFSVRCVEEAR